MEQDAGTAWMEAGILTMCKVAAMVTCLPSPFNARMSEIHDGSSAPKPSVY
jgi:hypothetical protein